MAEHPIILFDGICNLCNSVVQFVIKHDKKDLFRFASLQSETGKKLIEDLHLKIPLPDSFLLISGKEVYTRSTAALLVAKNLHGLLKWLYGFIIVPVFIRDAVYNIIAKNRYKWFGKKDQCMIPTTELQSKFL